MSPVQNKYVILGPFKIIAKTIEHYTQQRSFEYFPPFRIPSHADFIPEKLTSTLENINTKYQYWCKNFDEINLTGAHARTHNAPVHILWE